MPSATAGWNASERVRSNMLSDGGLLQRHADPADPPGLTGLQQIIEEGGPLLEHRVVGEVACHGHRLDLHAIALGNPDPRLPAVGFFGGVHGLARIGAEVVLTHLRSLVHRLRWDGVL